jgi:putative oxidoreductase
MITGIPGRIFLRLGFSQPQYFSFMKTMTSTVYTEAGRSTRLEEWMRWADARRDLFPDLARIYLGAGLFIKAIYFLTHPEFLHQTLQEAGSLWFAPALVAHYVIFAHLVGGLLLALGLLTRIAALVQIPVLAGAIVYLYLPRMMLIEPRQHLEFSALVLFLSVLFVIYGAGRWSLDHSLFKRSDQA